MAREIEVNSEPVTSSASVTCCRHAGARPRIDHQHRLVFRHLRGQRDATAYQAAKAALRWRTKNAARRVLGTRRSHQHESIQESHGHRRPSSRFADQPGASGTTTGSDGRKGSPVTSRGPPSTSPATSRRTFTGIDSKVDGGYESDSAPGDGTGSW